MPRPPAGPPPAAPPTLVMAREGRGGPGGEPTDILATGRPVDTPPFLVYAPAVVPAVAMLPWLFACAPSAPAPRAGAPVSASKAEPLDDAATLTRLDLDLLGRRPTPAALVAADGAAVAAARAAALDDPDLARRAAWLWNDTLHLAAWRDDLARLSVLNDATMRGLAWEPLAGIEAIVAEDRPFTDVLTSADWPEGEVTAALWDLPYTGTGGSWGWTRYADGRPLSGILSTNGLWMRYQADQTNFHRRRANMLTRVFLCADFFDRDVDIGFDAAIGGADIEDAVKQEPACANCHSGLDPLAGFLGGFSERSEPADLASAGRYSPWLATYAAARSPPAYFGNPGLTVTDLGRFIAADPRFPRCVVRRAYEGLTGASFDAAPEREALVHGFLDGGQRWDTLVVAVTETEAWADPALRRQSADQRITAVSDALGLPRGPTGAWSGLDDALLDGELRVMGGDTDDVNVLLRASAPSPADVLYAEWIAQTAVPEALTLDAARAPADRLLLPPHDETDEPNVRAQLATLYARFTGLLVAADGPEVDRLYTLWGAADADARWEEVVEALARHPRGALR